MHGRINSIRKCSWICWLPKGRTNCNKVIILREPQFKLVVEEDDIVFNIIKGFIVVNNLNFPFSPRLMSNSDEFMITWPIMKLFIELAASHQNMAENISLHYYHIKEEPRYDWLNGFYTIFSFQLYRTVCMHLCCVLIDSFYNLPGEQWAYSSKVSSGHILLRWAVDKFF